MKTSKKITALLVALVMMFAFTVPAFATDGSKNKEDEISARAQNRTLKLSLAYDCTDVTTVAVQHLIALLIIGYEEHANALSYTLLNPWHTTPNPVVITFTGTSIVYQTSGYNFVLQNAVY